MNIILINEKTGVSTHFRISKTLVLFVVLLAIALGLGGMLWSTQGINNAVILKTTTQSLESIKNETLAQKNLISTNQQKYERHFQALTMRMSAIQARLIRLDALGERLVEVAGLPEGEFDFSKTPPMGGPSDQDIGDIYKKPDFLTTLEDLLFELEVREEKIAVLEQLIHGDQMRYESFIAGRPVQKGWRSSEFGRRTDPFTGRLAWHKGVDYAAPHGTPVIAVAGGVVTFSGYRRGYGNLVEINHGGGFVTRYGHNSENLVKPGDVVKKADTVAKMGSTGRSTGPHVHLEVIKDGKHMNPAKYIRYSSASK